MTRRIHRCLAVLATIAALASLARAAPVELPAYDAVEGIERYATAEEYAAAVSDSRYRLEKVEYSSDSLRVFAYVYGPATTGTARPGVVFNRGSYVRGEFAAEHLVQFRRLADSGFVVIAPMYRQSGGAGGRDEMGGADLADLMRVADLVRSRPEIDAGQLFLYGESRGGMMVLQALRDGFPARAAAVYGAFTDLAMLFEENPAMRDMATRIWPEYAANADSIHVRRSALRWAERIQTPLLLMHGGQDQGLSPQHSMRLASRMQETGVPYELVIRAHANHVLTQWREGRDAHAVEWFRRHADAGAAPARDR